MKAGGVFDNDQSGPGGEAGASGKVIIHAAGEAHSGQVDGSGTDVEELDKFRRGIAGRVVLDFRNNEVFRGGGNGPHDEAGFIQGAPFGAVEDPGFDQGGIDQCQRRGVGDGGGGDGSSDGSGVQSIQGVVDDTNRSGHFKLEATIDGSAVAGRLIGGVQEDGRDGGWVEFIFGSLQLRQHGRAAVIESAIDHRGDGRLPVRHRIIRRVAGGQAGDRVGIAPADRLGGHGFFDLGGAALKPGNILFLGQRPAIKEVAMRPVGKAQFILGILHQVLMHPLRVGKIEAVLIAATPWTRLVDHPTRGPQAVLGVANEKSKPLLPVAAARSPPVVRLVVT